MGSVMEISLDGLRIGQWGTVVSIQVPPALEHRLRVFGFVPGTRVYCRYRTPCRRATALELRGSVIALRTRDMQQIRVAV